MLQCAANVLQCPEVCCSVLQCVAAVCCSASQCVAVCCSVLQCVVKNSKRKYGQRMFWTFLSCPPFKFHSHTPNTWCACERTRSRAQQLHCGNTALQCVAVCCSVLQFFNCVVVYCSVLPFLAVRVNCTAGIRHK